MTDPNDDLTHRLIGADPIDPTTLPTAHDPAARELLERIMNEQTGHPAMPAAHDPAAGAPILAGAAGPTSPPGRLARGRGLLIGAAAAVLLLVGGLLVFAPDNTPSAVAAVHSAAAAAADADTGRISSTFSLAAEGEHAVERVAGRFDASYAGADLAFSVQIDDHAGEIPLDELPFNQARLVDDVLYVDDGGQWLAIDTNGLLGGLVADFVDPRVVLDTIQELTETTEVGPATSDGVATTHYRSVVDLGEESLSQSGWLGFEGVAIEAEGEVTVDLFVDGSGLLNRLALSGDVRDGGSGDAGTFEVTMDFRDVGGDISVEAPADAVPFDPRGGLLDD